MIVAGVMSGTSADGINVALVRLRDGANGPRFTLLGAFEQPYPAAVRKQLLAMMNAPAASVADISRMDFLLGELYAQAVKAAMSRTGVRKIDLVGCHGQTIYHQGERAEFLGRRVACTWQLGEGAVVAGMLRTPVVSDFRPADMAAGGKGAPLVPFLDHAVYRSKTRGRILQNLGGIGNLTAIPAGGTRADLVAFDTGPGNMVIDACMEKLFGKRFDRGGRVAEKGNVLREVVREALREPFFSNRPPKTAGREEFGREYARAFLARCKGARKQDVMATATALTAESIGMALRKFVLRGARGNYRDYVVAGGGTKNRALMKMLAAEIEPLGLTMRGSEEFGVPAAAKEAIAFAMMAYETWNARPSNVPAATGATRDAVLGKISYA